MNDEQKAIDELRAQNIAKNLKEMKFVRLLNKVNKVNTCIGGLLDEGFLLTENEEMVIYGWLDNIRDRVLKSYTSAQGRQFYNVALNVVERERNC